jgi:hypothetical protein
MASVLLRRGFDDMGLRRGGLLLGLLLVAGVVPALGQARAARERCPVGVRVLPANGIRVAKKAALRSTASNYRGLDTKGARVVSSKRATAAGPRGAQVGHECGAKARARTVVVELRFPRMLPSASLSQGVVDVSRFAKGYRVWAVVH